MWYTSLLLYGPQRSLWTMFRNTTSSEAQDIRERSWGTFTVRCFYNMTCRFADAGMPEAREWDVELPKGVFHATEWIAAGFAACVDGRSAPLGGRGPQQFRTRHLGDNESRLSSPGWRVVLTFRIQSRLIKGWISIPNGSRFGGSRIL